MSDLQPTDTISRQAAIDALDEEPYVWDDTPEELKVWNMWHRHKDALMSLPSAHPPEIIRCNACRHWHQTTGKMKGFGLGDCDYLEKKLVTCNGYCYWAERRTDG